MAVHERQLELKGNIYIDDINVGSYDIWYTDLYGSDIPVQTRRQFVGDTVYLDSDDIGTAGFEWVDTVAGISAGSKNHKIKEVVRIG